MYVYVYTYVNVGNMRVILQWCASTPKSKLLKGTVVVYIYIVYIYMSNKHFGHDTEICFFLGLVTTSLPVILTHALLAELVDSGV